jgi:phage gpG-like protein
MKFNEAAILMKAQKEVALTIKEMVNEMGVMAVNHFTKSFANQGFDDNGIKRWQPRKNEISGGIGRTRKRDKGSRAILVKTGNLRKSLRKHRSGLFAVTITSSGTAARYANVHNEGIGRMPKRQFVGYSSNLNNKIIKRLDKRIQRVFK